MLLLLCPSVVNPATTMAAALDAAFVAVVIDPVEDMGD